MQIDIVGSTARLVAFAAMLAPVCSYGQTSSAELPVVIANSVTEFSGEQGKNGWRYGFWDRSIDTDGKYTQASDFKMLEHFGRDVRNGLSQHSDFTTGKLWFLEDGRSYTSLWAEGGHANSKMKFGDYDAAEQWAVRRWISNASGTVTIAGRVGKVMPWGANWKGECRAIIVVDGEIVLSTVMDEHGLDYAVAAKIREKSVVDFLIAPDPSIGVVTFTAAIRKRPADR